MKNNYMILLPITLMLDLIIPFIVAPSYKGYSHLTQVMSVLGNNKAPLHSFYNIWLIVCGSIIVITNFTLYSIVSKRSKTIAILLFIVISIYAIGGCILSGFFSVGETKSLDTVSAKIHGYGSVIGFMVLLFAPLLIGIYSFKTKQMLFFVLSILCFVMAVIFFVLFVMADKPNYQNTIIALEGLWQRLTLLCMYIPIAGIVFFQLLESEKRMYK